jgi:hypothetical protein
MLFAGHCRAEQKNMHKEVPVRRESLPHQVPANVKATNVALVIPVRGWLDSEVLEDLVTWHGHEVAIHAWKVQKVVLTQLHTTLPQTKEDDLAGKKQSEAAFP